MHESDLFIPVEMFVPLMMEAKANVFEALDNALIFHSTPHRNSLRWKHGKRNKMTTFETIDDRFRPQDMLSSVERLPF